MKKEDLVKTNKDYKILFIIDQDPYWDEGSMMYPRYRRGFKNPHKFLYSYQVRMYRCWKYNRKKQWK